jgi:glutathione S-transferase
VTEIILHHYPTSPFAEKARLLLGFKQLPWKSVLIPRVMPKPDVVALTGGYRKTPILQIGADVYCDTSLIARKLEELAPVPTLFPVAHAAAIHALSQWADAHLFIAAVVVAFQPEVMATTFDSVEEMKTFAADRAAMRKGATARRMPLAEAKPALTVFLQQLEAQLGDGRRFLFGDAANVADFSVYHPLWFLRVRPMVLPLLTPYERVCAWLDQIAAIGHGVVGELSSGEAVEIANRSTAASVQRESDADGLAPGDLVEVLPTDYGLDPVAGELLVCNLTEIAVRRRDARAGEVVVHFPRLSYELRKAAADAD